VSYPSPGVNNSSQGFRDNFAGIKNNIEIAKTELADLQKNVLVKGALSGTTMANDMNGGIISNVQTIGFRNSIYQLGSNLSSTVTVDCSLGDVHSGTMSSDINLSFCKWAPTGTRSSVEVILTVVAGQKIGIPDQVMYGIDTIEGYDSTLGDIVVPAGVTRVHYVFSTMDCGTTIEVMPVDRPRVTTQIKWGIPTSPMTGTVTTLTTSNSTVIVGSENYANANTLTNVTLYTTAGVKIGTVASSGVTSGGNTAVTFDANALVALTSANFIKASSRGRTGDFAGDIMLDATYLYTCTASYTDGSANIWNRTTLGTTGW
jgi:hypothetical protein